MQAGGRSRMHKCYAGITLYDRKERGGVSGRAVAVVVGRSGSVAQCRLVVCGISSSQKQ